ncbi:MAG: hypothetical protein IPJ31_04025 [Bacteroidetes bacterium]|nr:hypothetical protein [Bacteroidota bacterium]MBP6314121.1 hypothetical protein [Chitinophagaceae bacterium]
MRKFFPLILIGMVIMVSSCTREYICQCVVKYSGNPPALPDSTVFEFAIKDKKKEAAKKCEANSISITQDNITMDEKCRLY